MDSDRDIFQRVREAVDIAALIGERVPLTRAGREFKGRCPFHEGAGAPLVVVPTKQIFHCFVCGEGGDVFRFVMEYLQVSSADALRMLAKCAGIELPASLRRGGNGDGKGGADREDSRP